MTKALELRTRWASAQGDDLEKIKAFYPEVCYEVIYMRPGNEFIDFTCAIFHPEKISAELDALGIDTFTISGGWSGAAETIAEFEKLGFKLMGLVYVASQSVNFESGERERVPAFLLKKKGA